MFSQYARFLKSQCPVRFPTERMSTPAGITENNLITRDILPIYLLPTHRHSHSNRHSLNRHSHSNRYSLNRRSMSQNVFSQQESAGNSNLLDLPDEFILPNKHSELQINITRIRDSSLKDCPHCVKKIKIKRERFVCYCST